MGGLGKGEKCDNTPSPVSGTPRRLASGLFARWTILPPSLPTKTPHPGASRQEVGGSAHLPPFMKRVAFPHLGPVQVPPGVSFHVEDNLFRTRVASRSLVVCRLAIGPRPVRGALGLLGFCGLFLGVLLLCGLGESRISDSL